MSANGVSIAERPPARQLWKLAAYFVGLFTLGQLLRLVFEQLNALGALQGLAKASLIVARSLDVTHNRDDAVTTVWSLVLAALFVLPLGWVYTYTKAREGYDKSLVQSLVVMAMIVSGMMMLIQDQFSRALALVGVVSAVRFRTNLRDPKDAAYLLISIGIGMGTGLQVYGVAAWLTVVMSAAFVLLSRFRVGESPAVDADFVALAAGKGKKKKEKNGPQAPAADPGEVFSLHRYAAVAEGIEDTEQGIRRPNAVLVIETTDHEATHGVAEALRACGITWHLVEVRQQADAATIEYLLRLDRDDLQLALAAKAVRDRCGDAVRGLRATILTTPKAGSGADPQQLGIAGPQPN